MDKTAVIDADSLLIRAGAVCQSDYEVRETSGKLLGQYKSKRAFFQETDGYSKDDVIFEYKPIVNPNAGLPLAISLFNRSVNKILDIPGISKGIIVVQGKGNFRNSLAMVLPYKGNRTDKQKPILCESIKDNLVKRGFGKHKVKLVNYQESDDEVAMLGWRSYKAALKVRRREGSKVVLCHIDKDIDQVPGYHLNYNDMERGYYWINALEAARSFWKQTLTGDSVDNIPGLDMTGALKSEQTLKVASIGPKTADVLLKTCTCEAHMAEIAVTCYKASYSEGWYNRLEEVCRLLYLRRKRDELFCLDKYLDGLKVKYAD